MNVPGDIEVVVKKIEELVVRDRNIQEQSGEYEQCGQQDRFLAQIANHAVQGTSKTEGIFVPRKFERKVFRKPHQCFQAK
jgi:hypothetical protein